MTANDILATLSAHIPELAREFGVSQIGIFGSAARGEMGPESDIDVMVDFHPDRVPGLFKFVGLQLHLEKLLDRKVDLVAAGAEKPRIRQSIHKDLRYA